MEGFGVGTWDLDLSTRELEWSDATRSLFGVGREEPVSYELFLSLLEPGDRERIDRAIRKVAETGGSLDISFKLRQQAQASGSGFAPAAAWSGTRPGSPAMSAASRSTSTRKSSSRTR